MRYVLFEYEAYHFYIGDFVKSSDNLNDLLKTKFYKKYTDYQAILDVVEGKYTTRFEGEETWDEWSPCHE